MESRMLRTPFRGILKVPTIIPEGQPLSEDGSHYDIILRSSIDGGARANSLGYEKNVFNSRENFESMLSFIGH